MEKLKVASVEIRDGRGETQKGTQPATVGNDANEINHMEICINQISP